MKAAISTIILSFMIIGPVTSIAAKDGQIYKDWKVQCTKNPGDKAAPNCHIFQNLVAKEGNQRILHIAVGYAPGHNDPAAIITMPLGLSLPPGIAIQIDDKKAKRYPFQACFKTGCQIGFPIDGKLLKDFKAGSVMNVTLFDLKQQGIKIPVSLRGFSAAIKTLNPSSG